MNRRKSTLILVLLALLTLTSMNSCRAKYGCDATEKYKVNVDKNGKLKTKRGKTNLFPKKMRKKTRAKG